MEAVLERLEWLLYPKFVHASFTVAAYRMLRARFSAKRMKLQTANVLLSFTWLVATLFGPRRSGGTKNCTTAPGPKVPKPHEQK
eukprot:3661746-Amphidinium_carterae.1